ncbi:MAG: YdcF family protein [Gammaproteobacteria bacterium]|nr:YdcF family protein [Gammaproteobacteria bacterium]
MWALSLPVFAKKIAAPLKHTPPLVHIAYEPHAAIVILGGSRACNAPEFQGNDDVSQYALMRLRYGAYLAKQSHLPVLVSGGSLFKEKDSAAALMKKSLARDFGITAKWVEEGSRNTQENAINSLKILRKEKIKKIYLVTHVMHMPRSLRAFKNADIQIIPAPIEFGIASIPGEPIFEWLPDMAALNMSEGALYEYEGQLWQALRYQHN